MHECVNQDPVASEGGNDMLEGSSDAWVDEELEKSEVVDVVCHAPERSVKPPKKRSTPPWTTDRMQ